MNTNTPDLTQYGIDPHEVDNFIEASNPFEGKGQVVTFPEILRPVTVMARSCWHDVFISDDMLDALSSGSVTFAQIELAHFGTAKDTVIEIAPNRWFIPTGANNIVIVDLAENNEAWEIKGADLTIEQKFAQIEALGFIHLGKARMHKGRGEAKNLVKKEINRRAR